MKYILFPLLAGAAFLPVASAQVLITADFATNPGLTLSTTVVNPETWYTVSDTRFTYNASAEAVRRSTGSPAAFTGLAYAGDAIAFDNNLTLSFTYNTDFTNATMKVGIYGVLSPNDGFGGGTTRLRTDDGGTNGNGAGSEWQVLQLGTPTLSGSGTYTLNWTHTGTDYVNLGLVIATTNLTAGGGTFFDITGVTITQVPEPTTWVLLTGGLAAAIAFRRRRVG